MRTIGLLGGMSWESSLEYYRVMNEEVKARLGGLHSAKILMNSVEFQELRDLMCAGNWDAIGEKLADAARTLEKAGADMMVIGTNTMHKVAQQVADAVSIPLIHIADATAEAAKEQGFTRVALLGTIFTMEDDIYVGRLKEHGFEVMVPNAEDRKLVDRVIFDELCKGALLDESRAEYLRIINDLSPEFDRRHQAVILGCTEIGLLVRPDDTHVPTLDTCKIHATKAVEKALG